MNADLLKIVIYIAGEEHDVNLSVSNMEMPAGDPSGRTGRVIGDLAGWEKQIDKRFLRFQV